MIANNIFRAIGDFCTNVLFKYSYDIFRSMDGWWTSNTMNIFIFLLGTMALFYWLAEMVRHSKDAKAL
jgi:hypothetical protein